LDRYAHATELLQNRQYLRQRGRVGDDGIGIGHRLGDRRTLLAHQFEQARELYADTWLGFTEAEMEGLLTDAGFEGVEAEVVSRDEQNPVFQTMLATGRKP
jgi:hypothetical protein